MAVIFGRDGRPLHFPQDACVALLVRPGNFHSAFARDLNAAPHITKFGMAGPAFSKTLLKVSSPLFAPLYISMSFKQEMRTI